MGVMMLATSGRTARGSVREKCYHMGCGGECYGEYGKVEEEDLNEDKCGDGGGVPKNVVEEVKPAVQGEGGDGRPR